MTRNQRLLVLAGLIISAVFLLLAFSRLHPEEFLHSLEAVDMGWVLLSAAFYFVSLMVIAQRWGFLLRSIRHVRLPSLMELVSIGYMGNNTYPLRAGEALRIYLLRRNHAVPVTKATTTVVVERVFDGLVLLAFTFIGLLLADIQSPEIAGAVTLATPPFLIAMAVFFLLAARPQLLRWFRARTLRFLPQRVGRVLDSLSEQMLEGLEGLRSPLNLAGAVLASFVTWALQAYVYWMVMWAFGFDPGFAVALVVVGTVNLAGLIPASPGQFGVYEAVVQAVLMAAGLGAGTALAYAFVSHMVIWLPVTLIGFGLLVRQGLGLADVARAQELETQAAAG